MTTAVLLVAKVLVHGTQFHRKLITAITRALLNVFHMFEAVFIMLLSFVFYVNRIENETPHYVLL